MKCRYRVVDSEVDGIHLWWIVDDIKRNRVAGPYNVPVTIHQVKPVGKYRYEVRPDGANYADMLP